MSAVAALATRSSGGIRRYCSGCARETEHVLTSTEGLGSIASIRWRGFEPGRDTTTCLNCGQWRALGYSFLAAAQ